MRRTALPAALVVLSAFALLAVAGPALAQTIPGLTSPASAPTPPVATEDALRRETPRGTLLGFVDTAQAGNYAAAAQYLQWPRARLGISHEEAAQQLMFALNHGYEGSLERVSRTPEGSLADGLPSEKERVGSVVLASGERVDILLERVTLPQTATPVWLVAAATVAEIPRLHSESGLPQIERALPSALTRTQFGGLPLWVPVALILLLPIIYFGLRLALGLVATLARLVTTWRGVAGPRWVKATWRALSKPTAFMLAIFLLGQAGYRIGIPLYHRFLFARTIRILLLIGFVWWLWRLQALLADHIRDYLERTNAGRAQSAYSIGRRVLRVFTFTITVLVTLAVFGVDLSATLAGLGIGGLALAFAAQKTLENVFAGISVLSDRSVVVGETYQIGKYVGTVEDVGLRTMTLRTLSRSVVHVPNGTLATTEVENLSRRDKFLMQSVLPLRPDTSVSQMEQVLAGVRALIEVDALVEADSQRVRLIKAGPYTLDVEVFAYLLVPDFAAFLEHQERILLATMRVIADAGTGLTSPLQAPIARGA